jgi:8-amino-7-oxononanoate synthase
VICGAPEAALDFSERLRKAGFWATPIRPQTVPKGTARVRLAFTGAHIESDVDRLLEIIGKTAPPALAKPDARAHPA